MSDIVQVGEWHGFPLFGYAEEKRPLAVGDVLHGFCGGVFGRDHYDCCRVEAVGPDWVVVRDLEPAIGTGLDFAAGRDSMVALREHRKPASRGHDGGSCCAEGSMADQHPAVAFLVAAHERAERLANASSGGTWVVAERSSCDCCDEVRNEAGGLVATADLDDAPLIAEHANPTAVLRRVAAERDVLAARAEAEATLGEAFANPDQVHPANAGIFVGKLNALTLAVKALAAGWGWEAEGDATQPGAS